jgi:hypothetical protein
MRRILNAIALMAAVLAARPPNPQTPDIVTSLFQMTDLSFGLYSGMIPLSGTKKYLHYVAALSQGDWSVDPVVIWFNGGPGCSSMLGWT